MKPVTDIRYCDLHFNATQTFHESKIENLCFQDQPPMCSLPSITLRRAIAHGLKKLVCLFRDSRSGDCEECSAGFHCPYALIFGGANQPFLLRNIRISRTDFGWRLTFTLRLLGATVDLTPYLIVAVDRMLSRGFSRYRQLFTLSSVHDGQKIIFQKDRQSIRAPQTYTVDFHSVFNSASSADHPVEVSVQSVSPIHISKDGRYKTNPGFADLVSAGLERFKLINAFYGRQMELPSAELLDAARNVRAVQEIFSPWSINRPGSGEQSPPLQGIYLNAIYSNCKYRLARFLELTSQLHLGRYGSFGLGQVNIEGLRT